MKALDWNFDGNHSVAFSATSRVKETEEHFKMKFAAAFILFACFAAVLCEDGAMQISGNNVGDIITIGVNANAVLSNNMEQNIINVLLAALNQQVAAIASSDAAADADVPQS